MRLKLQLQTKADSVLPIDYRYYISSWIYKVLSKSDADFSKWLHDTGYDIGNKKFKLFCFGDIMAERFLVKERKLQICTNQCSLTLSFYIDDSLKHFVKGIFSDQRFSIGNHDCRADFRVEAVELLPEPKFDWKIKYETVSPIHVRKNREDGSAEYLNPMDEGYAEILINNLLDKYESVHGQKLAADDIQFSLVPGKIRSKIHVVGAEKIKVRAFNYNFELQAPVEVHRIGYLSGFGSQNSALGYGMVSVKLE